ncbi:uncharacterized protein Z520_08264 [Fonsecaea multimorphosa CBS 102226]|uniref:AB hydrolase-1 domain-containing protein n=1 Tax=Fonsecaea multimorphosa CBS 102226 TaxID=1442371 RepID=A0A0D2JZJ1_9EURO|nr:uncharacterized protein Z520_08264 [Fonsecaea multimorphosa CBS 102226]KIX96009.1 hypothetical protein Z520_08264 [Fonsecaea multimorphosa CBS 102226]OAL21778.1 hypothetical protein AYO22_07720 [Fonsecaea multimorphosa]
MASPSNLEYTPLPERAEKAAAQMFVPPEQVQDRIAEFAHVQPPVENKDGDTEVFEGETFTHHFVLGPGDGEVVRWHYVEAGPHDGEVIVFLHGIPDSWYQWHLQMAALAKTFRCIAVDLKGYGQSDKTAGDYRHEGVGEQLFDMLKLIGVQRFNIVSHDRGTVPADFIVANHPDNVLRYARGEQHLFHYNPKLSPQGDLFMNAPYNGILDDTCRLVVTAHASLCVRPIATHHVERLIQEFSYPGISKAIPRYFNSSTFRSEWLQRAQPPPRRMEMPGIDTPGVRKQDAAERVLRGHL